MDTVNRFLVALDNFQAHVETSQYDFGNNPDLIRAMEVAKQEVIALYEQAKTTEFERGQIFQSDLEAGNRKWHGE